MAVTARAWSVSVNYCVGITGGAGSGKSTVAGLFAACGAYLIDTDSIARELSAAGGQALPLILEEFGEQAQGSDGGLDRDVMRQLVFGEQGHLARQKLETILHPMIAEECQRLITAAEGAYTMIEIPLLVEKKGWRELCQRILVVDCSLPKQISRMVAMRGWSQAEAEAVVATQARRSERLYVADDIINNDDDDKLSPGLRSQVERLHTVYLRQAAQLK